MIKRTRKKRGQYYQANRIPVRIIETERKSSFRTAFSLALVLILILSQTHVFSAFEAHIISVTATIDNGIADYLVINKVYYDVDLDHGQESKNEWIEIYNPTANDIVFKNWQICNSYECRTINPNVSIPAFGYALLSHDNTTWTKYWNVPAEVITINLGTAPEDGWSNNDTDMLILKDQDGNIVDQMNWGVPDVSWPNYNTDVWDPGVADVTEGNMLGRSPNGFDTNRPSDWQEFAIPVVIVIIPNGFETWWVGRTYTLEWTASSSAGNDSDLSIDIWYSRDSGETWANIVTGTENDGQYDWRISLFINGYYVASDQARIKVVATDLTTNFMITAWDMSDDDFCPPIDFDLLTPEELEMFNAFFGITPLEPLEELVPELPAEPTEESVEEPTEEEGRRPPVGESIEEPIDEPSEEPTEPLEEPVESSEPVVEVEEEPVDEVLPVTNGGTEEIPSGTENPEPEPIIEEQPVILPETVIPEEAVVLEEAAVPEEAPVLEPSPSDSPAPGSDPSSGNNTPLE